LVQRNLFFNILTNIVHAETTSEFRLLLDLAIAQSELWSHLITERSLNPKEK